MRKYKFTIPGRSIMLNELLKLHWGARKRKMSDMQWAVWARQKPQGKPLKKSIVTVVRHSIKLPDTDNLSGSMKLLMDVLVDVSKLHPYGLGFIVDDDPGHTTASISALKCKTLKEQRLEVTIEEVLA